VSDTTMLTSVMQIAYISIFFCLLSGILFIFICYSLGNSKVPD